MALLGATLHRPFFKSVFMSPIHFPWLQHLFSVGIQYLAFAVGFELDSLRGLFVRGNSMQMAHLSILLRRNDDVYAVLVQEHGGAIRVLIGHLER